MALDPTALELYVYLVHRDLTMRDAAPCRADPSTVGRLAEQYAGRRTFNYNGETRPGLVARCAGIMIYAMDGYGLTYEEVCGVADHEVANVLAVITPDNRMTEPTRHLKLREAIGLATDVGQLVKLAEIAAFTHKVNHELTENEYLRHGQTIKFVIDRHGQIVQAMSRLQTQQNSAQLVEVARESLVKTAHRIEEVRRAHTGARQASQGCEAS
jgi:hypothetical protein